MSKIDMTQGSILGIADLHRKYLTTVIRNR